jgi:hypothetical protein
MLFFLLFFDGHRKYGFFTVQEYSPKNHKIIVLFSVTGTVNSLKCTYLWQSHVSEPVNPGL